MTDEPTQETARTAPDDGAPKPAANRGAQAANTPAQALRQHDRPADAPREPAPESPVPEPGPRLWPRVVGVLILLVGAGAVWLWQEPETIRRVWESVFPPSGQAAALTDLRARVARLEARPPPDLAPLAARLDALEQRVTQARSSGLAAATADSQPVIARLNALEARLARGSPAPAALAADQQQILARLDALEKRVAEAPSTGSAGTASAGTGSAGAPDLAPILARLDALETRAGQPAPDSRPLLARLDALEKSAAERSLDAERINALAGRVEAMAVQNPAAALGEQLGALSRQMRDLSANEAKQAAMSARAVLLTRAELALASGRPVGLIPDAPPALARFATQAPPTLADLRLRFPEAARAALKVSAPEDGDKPFLDRVVARLTDSPLITVRMGGHLLLGSAASAELAKARTLLDAGDLGGAADAVGSLSGPVAEKMAPWLADARAVLAAEAALETLAGSGAGPD